MNAKTPCSDYIKTNGIVFFARMLDKIRLNAQGLLPHGYNLGFSDPGCFDARFCRFWEIDFDKLAKRTLEGGSNEEVLDWCFAGRKQPNEDQILAWNSFIEKLGWRDESSEELERAKQVNGFGQRNDVQTWVDFHDVDEGRKPKFAE